MAEPQTFQTLPDGDRDPSLGKSEELLASAGIDPDVCWLGEPRYSSADAPTATATPTPSGRNVRNAQAKARYAENVSAHA
jgi:hypothetical protein